MQLYISFILLPVLFVLLTGCMEKQPDTAAMITAANELDQKFFDAYSSKDLETIKELYWNSPDLVSYPPSDMEQRGYDAVINPSKRILIVE